MFSFKLLAIFCVICTVSGQACPPTEIVLVLDFSDTARFAASSTLNPFSSFDLLISALDKFLTSPYVANSGNDFRIGAVGYGSYGSFEYIPFRSSPNRARQYIHGIVNETLGSSWTFIGLREVQATVPLYPSNRVIVVSAQGTSSSSGVNSFTEASRLRAKGWNIEVIAVQGRSPLDMYELTTINNNERPTVLDDTSVGGYRLLSNELTNIITSMCSVYKPPPNPSPVQPDPHTSLVTKRPCMCKDCLLDAGFGFDADSQYCDRFYQCVKDSNPISKMCPAGTFWDGSLCNFINLVKCPSAPCDATTPPGTRYASGRCCNKYFECVRGELVETQCPIGQYFDVGFRQCLANVNPSQICTGTGRVECDVDRTGPSNAPKCPGYAPDPFANPCKYQFNGQSMNVAPGTIWNQKKCALDYANNTYCYKQIDSRYYAPSRICNANFLSSFNGGSQTVFSERLNTNLDIYVVQNQAQLTRDALLFTPGMQDPFYYFYFFNNKQFVPNTAFRIRFRLDNPQINKEYDILSNNYCALCPETIGFSVTALSPSRRGVKVMFVTQGQSVTTASSAIDLNSASNMIELVIVFGERSLIAQLRELNGLTSSNVLQRINFNSVIRTPGPVMTNKCGIQLGRGPNSNFVGLIDEFAVYESCININSVLSI